MNIPIYSKMRLLQAVFILLCRYYEEADHGISWQTDQVRNWRRSATNAVEALLQS